MTSSNFRKSFIFIEENRVKNWCSFLFENSLYMKKMKLFWKIRKSSSPLKWDFETRSFSFFFFFYQNRSGITRLHLWCIRCFWYFSWEISEVFVQWSLLKSAMKERKYVSSLPSHWFWYQVWMACIFRFRTIIYYCYSSETTENCRDPQIRFVASKSKYASN